MRRLKRAILRHRAERKGVKPSLYVMRAWDKIQVRAVGAHRRAVNVWHGTKNQAAVEGRVKTNKDKQRQTIPARGSGRGVGKRAAGAAPFRAGN